MLGVLDRARRDLLVRTSRTKPVRTSSPSWQDSTGAGVRRPGEVVPTPWSSVLDNGPIPHQQGDPRRPAPNGALAHRRVAAEYAPELNDIDASGAT
jgi:hypothetical protein